MRVIRIVLSLGLSLSSLATLHAETLAPGCDGPDIFKTFGIKLYNWLYKLKTGALRDYVKAHEQGDPQFTYLMGDIAADLDYLGIELSPVEVDTLIDFLRRDFQAIAMARGNAPLRDLPIGLAKVLSGDLFAKWGRHFADIGVIDAHTPLPPQQRVPGNVLRNEDARIRRVLRMRGIEVSISSAKPKVANTLKEQGDAEGAAEAEQFSSILVLETLPRGSGRAAADTIFLDHPDLVTQWEALKTADYQLAIDTSMGFSTAGAYINHGQKLVGMPIDALWMKFDHEFSHFKFAQLLTARRQRSLSLKQATLEELEQHFSPAQARLLYELKGERLPITSLDESLAVYTELLGHGVHIINPRSISALYAAQSLAYRYRNLVSDLERARASAGPDSKQHGARLLAARILANFYGLSQGMLANRTRLPRSFGGVSIFLNARAFDGLELINEPSDAANSVVLIRREDGALVLVFIPAT